MTDKQSVKDWAMNNIAGSFANGAEAAKRLALAAKHCHLVGGASVMPSIVGHEIMISVVPIDRGDVYPANPSARTVAKGGEPSASDDPPKWGVGGATIQQLGTAACINWTDVERVDDGRDPFFVHYRVRGRYTMVDGVDRIIEGERDSDFRDGSAQLAKKSEAQIQQLRESILRSTITKAKLRAIRGALGLRHGLSTEDLDKPFVIARLVFTGQSDDPMTRRLFAAAIVAKQLAASNALYGPDGQMALGTINPFALLGPARLDEVVTDDGEVIDAVASSPGQAPPAPVPPPPLAAAPRPQPKAKGAPTVPFGKNKGKAITELGDKSLEWYIDAAKEELADEDKAKFHAKTKLWLAALEAEKAGRAKPKDAPEDEQAPLPGVPPAREPGDDFDEFVPDDEGF